MTGLCSVKKNRIQNIVHSK